MTKQARAALRVVKDLNTVNALELAQLAGFNLPRPSAKEAKHRVTPREAPLPSPSAQLAVQKPPAASADQTRFLYGNPNRPKNPLPPVPLGFDKAKPSSKLPRLKTVASRPSPPAPRRSSLATVEEDVTMPEPTSPSPSSGPPAPSHLPSTSKSPRPSPSASSAPPTPSRLPSTSKPPSSSRPAPPSRTSTSSSSSTPRLPQPPRVGIAVLPQDPSLRSSPAAATPPPSHPYGQPASLHLPPVASAQHSRHPATDKSSQSARTIAVAADTRTLDPRTTSYPTHFANYRAAVARVAREDPAFGGCLLGGRCTFSAPGIPSRISQEHAQDHFEFLPSSPRECIWCLATFPSLVSLLQHEQAAEVFSHRPGTFSIEEQVALNKRWSTMKQMAVQEKADETGV